MADGHQRTDQNVESLAFIPFGPGIAFAAWCSLLTGASTQAAGELGTLAEEWRNFVSLRLKEDVEFLQRLTRSTGPDQVMMAYAEFWRKAGEDYGNEMATFTKLMTNMASNMAVSTQSATKKASTEPPRREAA